jgi:hypothetical protein
MLEYIIANGKLRVNTIQTFHFLPDDHSTDIKECGEMNSLRAFCALFLGKRQFWLIKFVNNFHENLEVQIPDGLNNNLMVEKFRVDESILSIRKFYFLNKIVLTFYREKFGRNFGN